MSNVVRDYSKEKVELKRLLKIYGQAKIAKDLSISPRNLNMILSGKKKFISQKIADRITYYESKYQVKSIERDMLKMMLTNKYIYKKNDKQVSLEEGMVYNFKDFTLGKDDSNAKFINTRSSDTKEHIDNVRKDSINRLLKEKDELWTTIFLLCMFLIICAGTIVRLAYLVRTY
jgi:phage antirepressor YoqD-like protein